MLLCGLLGPARVGSLLNFSLHFRSKQLQISQGYPAPTIDSMPRLHQIIKGVQISRGKDIDGKPSHSKLPITPGILRHLRRIQISANPSFDNMMLWAVAAATTFFSFCHSGEVTVEKEDSYDPDYHLSF